MNLYLGEISSRQNNHLSGTGKTYLVFGMNRIIPTNAETVPEIDIFVNNTSVNSVKQLQAKN
jgi:hypothetical protein